MVYLIYSKSIGENRFQQWDGVEYDSKQKADMSLEMAKAWVNSKPLLKKMKHQWKIVSISNKEKYSLKKIYVKAHITSSDDPLGMRKIIAGY